MTKISIWKNTKTVSYLPKDLILSYGTTMVNFTLVDGKTNKTDKDKRPVMEYK